MIYIDKVHQFLFHLVTAISVNVRQEIRNSLAATAISQIILTSIGQINQQDVMLKYQYLQFIIFQKTKI